MKVHCRTNLDLDYETWPDDLPTVPRVGDYVESCTNHRNNFRLVLEVHSVTFRQNEPPIVELNVKKHWNITQFYDWYAPLVGKSPQAFI